MAWVDGDAHEIVPSGSHKRLAVDVLLRYVHNNRFSSMASSNGSPNEPMATGATMVSAVLDGVDMNHPSAGVTQTEALQ